MAILIKGWGYWDTTQYPYGGCFRRAGEDISVTLTGNTDKRKGVEFKLGTREGWADKAAIREA